jgi:hypothetical protein
MGLCGDDRRLSTSTLVVHRSWLTRLREERWAGRLPFAERRDHSERRRPRPQGQVGRSEQQVTVRPGSSVRSRGRDGDVCNFRPDPRRVGDDDGRQSFSAYSGVLGRWVDDGPAAFGHGLVDGVTAARSATAKAACCQSRVGRGGVRSPVAFVAPPPEPVTSVKATSLPDYPDQRPHDKVRERPSNSLVRAF